MNKYLATGMLLVMAPLCPADQAEVDKSYELLMFPKGSSDFNKGMDLARSLDFNDLATLKDKLKQQHLGDVAKMITPPLTSANLEEILLAGKAYSFKKNLRQQLEDFKNKGSAKNVRLYGITTFQAQFVTQIKTTGIELAGKSWSPQIMSHILNGFTGLKSVDSYMGPRLTVEQVKLLLKNNPELENVHIAVALMSVQQIEDIKPAFDSIPNVSINTPDEITLDQYKAMMKITTDLSAFELEILATYPYGNTCRELVTIDSEDRWKKLWKEKGKPAPDVDFSRHIIIPHQFDTGDMNHRGEVICSYREGYRARCPQTLVGYTPTGIYETTFYKVEKLIDK